MSGTPFWRDDFMELWNKPLEFIPQHDMDTASQWNALTRFCLYGAALILMLGLQKPIAILLLLVVVVVYLLKPSQGIWELIKRGYRKESYYAAQVLTGIPRSKEPCLKPTDENPFMNITVDQYAPDKANRPPACVLNDPVISKQANEYFNSDLFQDVDDVFGKKTAERNYYTTAITTIPNNQNEFAKWCYGNGAPQKDAFKAMQM